MARKRVKRNLLKRYRKPLIVGGIVLVALVATFIVVKSVAGKDIEVWWILRGLEEDRKGTLEELKSLGRSHRDALACAVRGGDRGFLDQFELSVLLFGRPFYGEDLLRQALEEDDPIVRRAAATALLGLADPRERPPIPDDCFRVFEDWCDDAVDPWLSKGLPHLGLYRDPRLLDLLIGLVEKRSQDWSQDPKEIGRANASRQAAASLLKAYLPDPSVIRIFEEVVRREDEGEMVQFEVWKSLASKGYAADPEIYWKAARSENDFVRQTISEHLQQVKSPEVVPILVHLTHDRHDTVRRGAVDSLIALRSPRLMEEIWYLGEDSYSSIKGDLASAVDAFRRDDLIPYLAWCLLDNDPIVVEKAVVALNRSGKAHHGFSDVEWTAYLESDPSIHGGNRGTARMNIMRAFIKDDKRREDAVSAWAKSHPPRYTDEERIPHLIRQLGHADRKNVKRAIRALVRITGRKKGFPVDLLDPAAETQAEAEAMARFLQVLRESVIADWKAWHEGR